MVSRAFKAKYPNVVKCLDKDTVIELESISRTGVNKTTRKSTISLKDIINNSNNRRKKLWQ